jgi:hypothetical protein
MQFPRDCTCNRFGILFHVLVAKTNDFSAHGFQVLLPFQIVFHDVVVIPAINLDNQHLLRARKVHDPRFNRMLASKLQSAQLSRSQHTPQRALGNRLCFA